MGKGSSLGPVTYTAYDKDGKEVGRFAAQNADNYINPAEVKAAIDNLKTEFQTQMKTLAVNLNSLSLDATHAVIVQGTKMDTQINDLAVSIQNDIPKLALEGIDNIFDAAVTVHDKIQKQLNDIAKSDAQKAAGSGGTVK